MNRFSLSNTLLLSFFTLLLFSAGCFEPVEGDDGSDSSATEDEDEDEDENEGEDGGAQPAPDAGSPTTDGGATGMHRDGGQPSPPDSGSPTNDAGNSAPDTEDSGNANPPDAGSSMMDHQDGGAMTAPDAGTPMMGNEDSGTITDADAGASAPDAGSPDGGSNNTMPTCTTDLLEWTAHKTDDGLHPDAHEQKLVWLMNRARQDPTAEGIWLAESTDPDVAIGRDYFGVDPDMIKTDFAALSPKPPAAFDAQLYEASRLHSVDMMERNSQDHDGQFDKINASGFNMSGGRVSVFAYGDSALNVHAALNIDWGFTSTGVQDPPGHRFAIMGVLFPGAQNELSNVGFAMVPNNDPTTDMGPFVFSGAYLSGGGGEYNRFIVGTVFHDANENQIYDEGEGLEGVHVIPDSGYYFAITGEAGGYAIPVIDPGTFNVSFGCGSLSTAETKTITLDEDSVLLDHIVP